jgi:hypothetical protein
MSRNYTEQQEVEYETENALQSLRSDDNSSRFKRNKWRDTVTHNLAWLRENANESYLLEQDLSDVSLTSE